MVHLTKLFTLILICCTHLLTAQQWGVGLYTRADQTILFREKGLPGGGYFSNPFIPYPAFGLECSYRGAGHKYSLLIENYSQFTNVRLHREDSIPFGINSSSSGGLMPVGIGLKYLKQVYAAKKIALDAGLGIMVKRYNANRATSLGGISRPGVYQFLNYKVDKSNNWNLTLLANVLVNFKIWKRGELSLGVNLHLGLWQLEKSYYYAKFYRTGEEYYFNFIQNGSLVGLHIGYTHYFGPSVPQLK